MKDKLKLNSQLIHYLLLTIIVLLVLAAVLGANSMVGLLQSKANTLVSLESKKEALSTEQSNLVLAKKEVAKYSPLEKIAQTIVPQNKDQAEAVREIVNIAQQTGITLTSIVFPSSTLGNGVTSSKPASSASNNAVSLSQLTAVRGIPGVYMLPILINDSLQADAVTYSSFYTFLTKIEQNRLTSQVTGLTIQPMTGNSNLITFSLSINEYIKPL